MSAESINVYLPTEDEFIKWYVFRSGFYSSNVKSKEIAREVYHKLLDKGLTGDIWAVVENAKSYREDKIESACSKCKHFTGKTDSDELLCFCDYAPKMKRWYCKSDRKLYIHDKIVSRLFNSKFYLVRVMTEKISALRFRRHMKKIHNGKKH